VATEEAREAQQMRNLRGRLEKQREAGTLSKQDSVVTPSRVGWPNKAFAEYNRLLVYFNSNMP
jgi:hypothetical protein